MFQTYAGRLESAIAQLGPDPVETGLRKSLPENMCSLSDVPEDYIKGLDIRQVKVGRGCTVDRFTKELFWSGFHGGFPRLHIVKLQIGTFTFQVAGGSRTPYRQLLERQEKDTDETCGKETLLDLYLFTVA